MNSNEKEEKLKNVTLNRFPQAVEDSRTCSKEVKDHLDMVPSKYKNRLLKALRGELSPKEAIKMHCLYCVGYRDIHKMIGDCTSKICPLWTYRPFQKISGSN